MAPTVEIFAVPMRFDPIRSDPLHFTSKQNAACCCCSPLQLALKAVESNHFHRRHHRLLIVILSICCPPSLLRYRSLDVIRVRYCLSFCQQRILPNIQVDYILGIFSLSTNLCWRGEIMPWFLDVSNKNTETLLFFFCLFRKNNFSSTD